MDDWGEEVDDGDAKHAIERSVSGRAGPDPAAIAVARRAARPRRRTRTLVVGPDVDASGAWEAAVALAERQRLPVWATPGPGGGRIGFPEGHPSFRGTLPPAIGPLGEMLAGHDLVLVVGSSVFPYYPYIPARCWPRAPRWSRSRATPTRPRGRRWATRSSPTSGCAGGARSAEVARVRSTGPRAARRPRGAAGVRPPEPLARSTRRSARSSRRTGSWCSSRRRARWRFATSCGCRARELLLRRGRRPRVRPGRARSASSSREPSRPVVCVIGEGSVQYAVTAFWSAVAYKVPVTFLVLRNEEYSILKWFADLEQVSGAPGLDLPALDSAAIASRLRVESRRVTGARSSPRRSPRHPRLRARG